MLDPDSTNVLQRRVLASLVDLGLIAVATALIWRTQWIQFTITARDPITNAMIPDADQAARINEIAASLHTSFEWRGSLVVLDQTGIVLTALFGIVMAMVTFVLLPANTGWSPGKRLLGLSVVDSDGRIPGLAAHLARSVVGVVDAIPFVVPGLLGWLLAKNDDFHRRLGDRVARTHVIDAKAGVRFIDPGMYARRNELRRRVVEPDADGNAMVPIEDRLATSATLGAAPGDPIAADPQPVSTESSVISFPPPTSSPVPAEPAASRPSTVDAVPSSRAQMPPLFSVSTLGSPESESDHPTAKVPRPSHRLPALDSASPVAAHPVAESAAAEPTVAAPPSADDTAMTRPLVEREPMPGDESPVGRGRPDPERFDDDWDRPVPEPAPVWKPGRPGPQAVAGREPVRDFFDSTSLGSSSATGTTARAAVPDSAVATADPEPESVRSGSPENGTVWNDEWKAWLFWDPTGQRWLRHDTETDRWIPIG